jgi:hypothetical protein
LSRTTSPRRPPRVFSGSSCKIVASIAPLLSTPNPIQFPSERFADSVINSALDLTATAIRRNLDDPTEELNTSFTSAYNDVLKPHHNFLAKKAFGFAMNSVPYRKDFYAKIGVSPYELSAEQEQFSAEQLKGVKDQLNSPLAPEIAALKNVVTILNNFDDLTKCK